MPIVILLDCLSLSQGIGLYDNYVVNLEGRDEWSFVDLKKIKERRFLVF